jgi:putative mRNA 3-end processing factor
MNPLLRWTAAGLHCAPGGFHIDPLEPVELALVTHAHADHARPGSAAYLCAAPGARLVEQRTGAPPRTLAYRERLALGDTVVSLHPAGHLLGSAQIRIEHGGEVWVVTGDYKRSPDPTCEAFEVVPCDVLVTEATFALPIYRFDEPAQVMDEVLGWWDRNRAAGRPSLLFCYALGKAQRILAELAARTDRTVFVHGALEPWTQLYRDAGLRLSPTERVADTARGRAFAGELVLAPPAASGSIWMRRFAGADTAFASGWMQVRGTRRRLGYDRGFVLSDHADWDQLLATVAQSGARRVLCWHGYGDTLARALTEQGLPAEALAITPFPRDAED